jgi:hypothetical protein
LLTADIEEIRKRSDLSAIQDSLKALVPTVMNEVDREEHRSEALSALGAVGELLGPENSEMYLRIEQRLLEALKEDSYEQRHRDRAGRVLERLPEVDESTIMELVRLVNEDPIVLKSSVRILARNYQRYELARKTLLEISRSSSVEKRAAFARESIGVDRPEDELLTRLVELVDNESDDEVKYWAICAFRADFPMEPEICERLVSSLAGIALDVSEPTRTRQVAISSLSTVVRKEPKYLSEFLVVCRAETLSTTLREGVIALLPWASQYSPEIRPILEEFSSASDSSIARAGDRALKDLNSQQR